MAWVGARCISGAGVAQGPGVPNRALHLRMNRAYEGDETGQLAFVLIADGFKGLW